MVTIDFKLRRGPGGVGMYGGVWGVLWVLWGVVRGCGVCGGCEGVRGCARWVWGLRGGCWGLLFQLFRFVFLSLWRGHLSIFLLILSLLEKFYLQTISQDGISIKLAAGTKTEHWTLSREHIFVFISRWHDFCQRHHPLARLRYLRTSNFLECLKASRWKPKLNKFLLSYR